MTRVASIAWQELGVRAKLKANMKKSIHANTAVEKNQPKIIRQRDTRPDRKKKRTSIEIQQGTGKQDNFGSKALGWRCSSGLLFERVRRWGDGGDSRKGG